MQLLSALNSVILGILSTCLKDIYAQGGGCVSDSVATKEENMRPEVKSFDLESCCNSRRKQWSF